MKVLYIGHYREGSGWSQAAIDYILALDYVGVDVVCRAVRLEHNNADLPKRILELEQKDSAGSTHCIQHVLPHYMDYNGRFEKNVGILISETDSIFWTGWPQRLKTMDEVWVPNNQAHKVALDCGLNNVRIVPHATDLEKFKKDIAPAVHAGYEDYFKFYFIGENNRRKRLSALLQAYYANFTVHDKVMLILKTNGDIVGMDKMIKNQLRMYSDERKYPLLSVNTDRIPEDALISLHRGSDCFVNASHGEAWSIPTFDAMGFGNWVISSDIGGMADFLEDYHKGLMIPGQMAPVIGADKLFYDVQTGHENWFSVDICQFGEAMRMLYEKHSVFTNLKSSKNNPVENYSYNNIGKLMKGYLNVEVSK